jgi:hypothetical protein
MEDNPIAVFYAYDESTLELYSHALGYSLALSGIKEILRQYLKYGHTFTSIDGAIEAIQHKVFDLVNDYHLPNE